MLFLVAEPLQQTITILAIDPHHLPRALVIKSKSLIPKLIKWSGKDTWLFATMTLKTLLFSGFSVSLNTLN